MARETIQRIDYSLADCVDASGRSLMTIHTAIKCGDLKSYLVGRRRYVRVVDLQAWLDLLRRESDEGRPRSYRSRDTDGMTSDERAEHNRRKFEAAQPRKRGRK